MTGGADSALRRRLRAILPAAIAGAVLLFFVAASGAASRPTALLFELYIPLRFFLLYRAARLTVRAARCDLVSGNLEHLAVSPMTGRELAAGWAIAGWSRALPETVATFVFLSPLILLAGPAGALIAAVDLFHLVLLQGLAALITSGLMVGFQHRHEAATAGWLSAVFAYPLVFLIQAVVIGLLFALLPLSVLLLLGASMPAGWPELDVSHVVDSGAILMAGAYALWFPVATLKEIDRQLELAEESSHTGLQKYLQHAAGLLKGPRE